MSMEWIRRTYGVPAKRSRRVVVDGKPGVIVGSSGPRLTVRFDGEKVSVPAHPTWRVTYLPTETEKQKMTELADRIVKAAAEAMGSDVAVDLAEHRDVAAAVLRTLADGLHPEIKLRALKPEGLRELADEIASETESI